MAHERELSAIDAALAGDDTTLDRLVKDPSEDVRVFVAKAARPQDLDILVSDFSALVRAAVARYGRPEDCQKLLADPSPIVRAEARRQKQHNDEIVTKLSAELAKDIKSCENETKDLPTLSLPKYDEYGDYQMVPAGQDDGVISDIYEKYTAKWRKRLDHDHYKFHVLAFYARQYQDQQAKAALKALDDFNVRF